MDIFTIISHDCLYKLIITVITITITLSSLLRKPPALRPRSSHPPSSVNMNDTYAVVNKIRQPSSMPPLVPHHYDNDSLKNPKPPVNDLYSTVKPKNRTVAKAPAGMFPVAERMWPINNRALAEVDCGGYEPLAG